MDRDAACDLLAFGRDPETVARGIEARKELSQLVRHLRLEVAPEAPFARVIAAVQLDDAADCARNVSADLHAPPSFRPFPKRAPGRSASGGSRKSPLRSRRASRRATGARPGNR